jgi:glycine oxidase|tara:strand:- start:157 stop:1221 length:1065 start_codon:yes stop_codon:yes gene_type:complete
VKSDLVIIGGGIIGLYSAYLLAQHDINITLIDKGDFGKESSWVAGGILAPLLPWQYNEKVLSLTADAATDYYHLSNNLLALTNVDIQYWQCGLAVHELCSGDIKQWCHHHNFVYEQINHPSLNQFHLPGIAQVRMPMVLEALISYLRQNNVTLLNNTTVHDYQLNDNKLVAVNTSSGKIYADHILSATGAWLPEIAGSNQKIRVPEINPIKGQVIAIQTIPGLLNHIIYKDGHYLIPRKDGLILAGSTLENVGYNKLTTDSARNALWSKSLSILPELSEYTITHHWAGLRPGSPKNIPTIGPHPDIKGLYLNAGHFRYGVAMAPKSAHIISQWILNNGSSLSEDERSYVNNNFS